MFILDSKLSQDSFVVCDLKISQLLLMNDSNYPWLILVPKKADLIELTDLSFEEQLEVLREINLIGEVLKEEFSVQKLNIAALGNVVKQLHIHVIGRFEDDASFPKPVWGAVTSKPYEERVAQELIKKLQLKISGKNGSFA
jgi:diadenosine tetraphosphate (Ap4A) HIT family hydrolase